MLTPEKKSKPVMDKMAMMTEKSDKKFLMYPGKYPVFLKFLREKLMVKAPAKRTTDIKSTLG